MSAIQVINTIPASTSPTAEFRLYQGAHQVARLGVHAGGSASVPTTSEYTAQAFTSLGDLSLTSNTVSFDDTSMTLLAQVNTEDGYYDFQLVTSPGFRPSTITCENTSRTPVKFKLQRPNSPFEVVTVVDEYNTVEISTAQEWMVYAIVNGITTPTSTITDPNATVILSGSGDEIRLEIS